ncbi:MAG: methyl-accepting chemotaxis protein [Lachnospiraceae bacterium]|nr:methyl-accepting chemotaxis protein [Lachnospiraceae bacterium]
MFKNLKVKVSLALGFGITIIISVAIIILMLLIIDYQSTTYSSIINSQVRANELILQCRIYTNIAARNVRDMALEPSDAQNETTQVHIDEAIAELEVYTKQLIEIYPLKDKGLEEYTNAMQDWYSEVPNILNAVNSGNQKEAIRIIKSDCTPKLNNMIDIAKSISANLLKEQNRIIAKQQEQSRLAETIMIIAAAVAALFVMFIALRLIASITKPVKQVSVALKGFSMGQLDIPVTYKSRSELGGMCDALRTSQHVLTELISDECHILDEMASGNFDVKTKDENIYVGELGNILKSIRAINRNISDAIGQIMQGAEQVASEAMQVSNGSQSLAQGSTEQASSVEQLASTIVEISNNSKNNAHNSEQASAQSKLAGRQVEESVRLMGEMVLAMEKISNSSNEIGKIIATIENIAFQTNILALNAAVEASRAGEVGKGFAVVAEEVRGLAAKSDEAAKATKNLIEHSILTVNEGSGIVKSVSDSLTKTVEISNNVLEAVHSITQATAEEAESIEQVTRGVNEISCVVQTNSATSEEFAATSAEMSNQAALMKDILSRFTLRR